MTETREEVRESLKGTNTGCLLLAIGVPGVFISLIASLFMVIGFTEMYSQERLLTEAVEVHAVVQEVRVERSSSSTGTGANRSSSTIHYPVVEYTYEFAAQPHTSDKVWPTAKSFSTRSEAQAIARRFTKGETVTAFVDPGDPATSYLLAEWTAGPYLGIAVGPPAIGLIVALGILLAGYRNLFRARVAVIASLTFTLITGAIATQHYFENFEPVSTTAAAITIGVTGLVSLGPIAALAKARSLRRVLLTSD